MFIRTSRSRKRRYIPLKVKLEAALYQLGLDPKHVRLDHHPPLEMRYKRISYRGEAFYSPDELDPRYMQFLSTAEHDEKTTGRRGTSKLSKRGGDISEIAKTKRLTQAEEQFRARVLAKYQVFKKRDQERWGDENQMYGEIKAGKRPWPKRKLRSRP